MDRPGGNLTVCSRALFCMVSCSPFEVSPGYMKPKKCAGEKDVERTGSCKPGRVPASSECTQDSTLDHLTYEQHNTARHQMAFVRISLATAPAGLGWTCGALRISARALNPTQCYTALPARLLRRLFLLLLFFSFFFLLDIACSARRTRNRGSASPPFLPDFRHPDFSILLALDLDCSSRLYLFAAPRFLLKSATLTLWVPPRLLPPRRMSSVVLVLLPGGLPSHQLK